MITIKSKKEIEILREGGRRHAKILDEVCKAVHPGVSTKELDDLAHMLIMQNNDMPSFLGYTPQGAKRPFPASSCISVNEEVIHGIPNENPKILKEGDIVGIDIGIIHEGLFTDSARTVGVGEIDEESKRLIDATEKALYFGIESAVGGGHVGDIGFEIENFTKSTGFLLADDLCGHGVGYGVHEDPYIPNTGKRGQGPILKPGMVIAIEPMLNIGTSRVKIQKDGYTYKTANGKKSAHFEHTILITEGSAEILTTVEH